MEATQVPATEFHARTAEYLDRSLAGERFVITRSGRATAQLGPIERTSDDDDHD